MDEHKQRPKSRHRASRRRFLQDVGRGAVAASLLADGGLLAAEEPNASKPQPGKVRHRELGKTGLKVSEIGFGGHSWSYPQVPDGKGDLRRISIDEAVEMIREALDMGVNYFDSCTPHRECSIPGEALKRLGKRDRAVICVRPTRKMKGIPSDKEEVFKWTEERLKLWQTDYIDLLLLSNESNVTPKSGYWDMTYSIEACDKLKKQGKIRFTGFGSHFEPRWFLEAFTKFGKYFDVCSMPYNVRHRVAEKVMPVAKKVGMGVVTIKPFARGSLLKKHDLGGKDAGLPRDLIRFVLENKHVDVCLCGVHTLKQARENFSASWTPLDPGRRRWLEKQVACLPTTEYPWLEHGWHHA